MAVVGRCQNAAGEFFGGREEIKAPTAEPIDVSDTVFCALPALVKAVLFALPQMRVVVTGTKLDAGGAQILMRWILNAVYNEVSDVVVTAIASAIPGPYEVGDPFVTTALPAEVN